MKNFKQAKLGLLTAIITFCISFIGIGIVGLNAEGTNNKDVILSGIEPQGIEQNIEQNIIENVKEDNTLDITSIPSYSSNPYVVINNNIPFFDTSDLTTSSYENYSNLDSLGRCGTATACIGKDIMPTDERGSIGSVKPTGWHTVKYSGIDGNYLYDRCHLIGYQLTGENANEKNLITGTRYLNVDGMLPFENMVADYIKETGNHVLYRVTPIFGGNNLLASGVLMEAKSVEDNGAGIEFNVYCYNVQPGIEIDYTTGESSGLEYTSNNTTSNTTTNNSTNTSTATNTTANSSSNTKDENKTEIIETSKSENATSNVNITSSYVLNTSTKKFHETTCSSISTMSEKNMKNYTGSRSDLISQGYVPCKKCNP